MADPATLTEVRLRVLELKADRTDETFKATADLTDALFDCIKKLDEEHDRLVEDATKYIADLLTRVEALENAA